MNNLLLLEDKRKRNYILLLTFTIFYFATYSASLWTKKFSQPLFGYIRYILLVFMLLVFIYYLLFFNRSKKRL